MEEQRKHAILFAATPLCARKLIETIESDKPKSRLSKAVKNADKASSIEAVFGFANVFCYATADSAIAVVNTKKPTIRYFLRSIPSTPVHKRSISAASGQSETSSARKSYLPLGNNPHA